MDKEPLLIFIHGLDSENHHTVLIIFYKPLQLKLHKECNIYLAI